MSEFGEGVDVLTDGQSFYSKTFRNRCVMELTIQTNAPDITIKYALYERNEKDGVRVGLTNQNGAWQWLNGEPLSSIKHYTVDDC